MENLKEIIKQLKTIPNENIYENEPMKKHTSFKIGGPAEIFIKIKTIDQLHEILEVINKYNIPLNIIGNGSNLLITDKGIKGIVIKLELKEINIKQNGNKRQIIVDAGVPLGLLAQKLLKEKITGFEEFSGIPGTIGGAVVMNAGAHGKEIKDLLTTVTAIDLKGNIHTFTNKEAEFDYRKSKFSNGEYIILQATLELEEGLPEKIKEKMDEFTKFRKEKQPVEYPNAGSTFKRGNDFITAQLIDEAGLKGYKIGGAKISEKHAGFIVNEADATFDDIMKLVEYVTTVIREKFGKEIQLEIKILGER